MTNPVLTYAGQPIFESEPITLGLRRQQVIHKGSGCLDVYDNAFVILLLTLLIDK